MPDDAEVTMILYADLLPEEEAVLKPMESAVIKALLANSVTARPVWTSSAESGARVVQLNVLGQPEPRILLDLPADEVAALSTDELVSRLNRSITQG